MPYGWNYGTFVHVESTSIRVYYTRSGPIWRDDFWDTVGGRGTRSGRLWVRFSVYWTRRKTWRWILPFNIQPAMPSEFGGKWGTQTSLNTPSPIERSVLPLGFTLPTLMCVGYSIQLQNIFFNYFIFIVFRYGQEKIIVCVNVKYLQMTNSTPQFVLSNRRWRLT